ncbi:HAD family hydrolase [uncultured Lactobacillus sp.]|uniref:HAD family hydrolase n=1 Tax=uncultured Lactobacillus sp. TaxID=153152 RepID=UPI0026089C25|nr:HAD family hydrolase [uncultured Lactobacillus sp.]
MNKIKIAFFDVDGTLVEKGKPISSKIIETLKRLKENGTMICISSGRSPKQISKLDVKFDALITFNGSYCFNEKETILNTPLKKQDMELVVKNAKKINRPVAVATKDRIAANGMDEDLKEYFAFGGTIPAIAEDFDQIVEKQTVYQMMVSCRKSDYDALMQNVDDAKITAWWDRAVDIIPASGSKGVAIKRMLDYYQIPASKAIAFGDGGNDIEMLKTVGCGIAMGNATDNVKKIADDICGSVQEDGIYTYCKEHNLI